jgi:hypothetical protein
MDRFLTVNVPKDTLHPRGIVDLKPPAEGAGVDGLEDQSFDEGPWAMPVGAPRGDQGPCLYFGSKGQRCGNAALASGFCAKHSGAGNAVTAEPLERRLNRKRLLAAIGTLAAVLGPILMELLKAIIRFTHWK